MNIQVLRLLIEKNIASELSARGVEITQRTYDMAERQVVENDYVGKTAKWGCFWSCEYEHGRFTIWEYVDRSGGVYFSVR